MLPNFSARYHAALNDRQLRANLLKFQRHWRTVRDHALQEIDFEADRQLLAAIKDRVIADLPAYLAQFEASARANGATVHYAVTPQEAIDRVLTIARERGIGRVVKSKSMISEEIELNHALQNAGIQVIESDLGEWIVQLAGERPSHIVAPAIHRNRRQIAELFARATGKTVDADRIEGQVAVAREALRQEFLSAHMGISGANAIVAETGTVMLVTNEGNAELVTSLPDVHVVLVGIEKLVPTLLDATLVLHLLGPSAAGQIASVYVSWITGPATPDQEVHIVLVDNGRMAMRESPLFRDALRCIRCGACSDICPSFGVVGGHVFGYIYSGAIGLVNTPFHHGIEHDAGPQSLCVSCNACQTVCPVDIPLPRQILDARAWAARAEGMPLIARVGLKIWSIPRLAQLGLRAGATVQKPVQRGRFVQPPGMGRLTRWRKLPALADHPFRATGPQPVPPLPGPLGRRLQGITIAYFVQCFTDWLYPEMAHAIVEVLQSLGARVVFPADQHCCGLPGADSGDPATGRKLARHTIETLEGCRADYVLSGGTSCVVAILHDYSHLFAEEPEWQMRAARLAERTMDFTTFMTRIADLPAGSLSGPEQVATYHYFCQSYNVLGFREEPLRLLGEVCGLTLQPLPEANVCCGFGGIVSVQRPEISEGILQRKLANVDESGAPLLVTDNPGCIMQLRGGMAASGRPVQVKHTAEVVAERIRALRSSS